MDRPTLSKLRDQMAALVTTHEQAGAQGSAVLAAIEAELNRDPTIADVQSMLAEVVARQKPAA